MIKLNRIGYKLGLAGAVAVLLAVGMAANQMWTEASVTDANQRAARSQKVADVSQASHLELRKVQLAARDIRLAKTQAEVEKAAAAMQRSKTAMAKELDVALKTAARAETQARLQKIKSSMDSYLAGVEDLARAQATLLTQIDTRQAISAEWTKALDTELASPALAKLDNRGDIERLLFQADAKVNSLRAAVWRLGADGGAALIPVMGQAAKSVNDVFNKLRGEADDRALLEVISSLSSVVKRFLAANEEVVKTEQLKTDIVVNRTSGVAIEAADLMEVVVDGAQKNSAVSKEEVGVEMAQANRIGLTMTVIVIGALIASMVFSFLGIARPMTRLNGALGEMAGGKLDVVIPGADRGDEIGDLAKTVVVTRENA